MLSGFKRGIPLLIVCLVIGCGQPPRGGPRLTTSPLKGVVNVDGEPTEGVEVTCTPEPGTSEIKYPIVASTDVNGQFSLGTYQAGDGLPEGKYILTFAWPELSMVPKDRLNKAYSDPAKSEHKVTVVTGEPNDLGEIELSTKSK